MPRKNRKGFVSIRSRHPSTDEHLLNRIPTEHSVVYRHGSTSESKKVIEINTIEAVKNSSNKLLMKQLFNGDHHADYFYYEQGMWYSNVVDEALTDEELIQRITFPVLSKLQYRSKGAGMEKWDKDADLSNVMEDIKMRFQMSRNQKYLERFRNFSKEYRLHCALGECFYACRKARKEGHHEFYRNSENSVWFTQFDEEGNIKDNFLQPHNWEVIVAECCRLQELVGLDIAAFDVIVSNKGSFRILECNSAPSIAEGTGIHYREIIPRIIENKLN